MKSFTLNPAFTRAMSELHTWGGLLFGWLLFAIFLTGTLSVFEPELSHWMQPDLRSPQAEPVQAVASADQKLRLLDPKADMWMIAMPQKRHPDLEVMWKKGNVMLEKHLDPQTGRILKAHDTEGGHFFADFHYQLHSGKTGLWIVSLASAVMLVTLVSGIAIRRQVFQEFFRLRWRPNWLNAHTMTGVLTLPFVLLITYTGMTITLFMVMPTVPKLLYGSTWHGPHMVASQNFDRPRANQPGEIVPLAALLPRAEEQLGKGNISFIRITNPHDRHAVVTFFRTVDDTIVAMSAKTAFDGVTGELLGTQSTWTKSVQAYRTLVGLHIARFGGYPICWLYFAAGLVSCIMIAAGLIFFTIKRRSRYSRSNPIAQRLFRVVEALNITAVMGVVIACTAFLWANRLLPFALKNRADAEINVFFMVWLLMLLHAFWRPPLRAWAEQTSLAALLCLGLPLLNALTTNVGLFPAITQNDWMTAGVDLTAGVLGAGFALVAKRIACPFPSARGNPSHKKTSIS